MNFNQYVKVALSIVVVVLAVVRLAYHDTLSTRMDIVFFSLVLAVFLVWLIPWERLQSLSMGGFGITLNQQPIEAAINGLRLDDVTTYAASPDELRQRLLRMESEIQAVRGSRVLWIDDNPHKILGERRLLRALGVDVVLAESSESAERQLEKDNDFDLIITDVQRKGESYKLVENGIQIHEGVNFIVKLRKHKLPPSIDDPNIRKLPVIFYAAYDWDRLVKFTRPARELSPEPEITNSEVDLFPKIIRKLYEERTKPIPHRKPRKLATGVEHGNER